MHGSFWNSSNNSTRYEYYTPFEFSESVVDSSQPEWQKMPDGGGAFLHTLIEKRRTPSSFVSLGGGVGDYLRYTGSLSASLPNCPIPIGNGSPFGAKLYDAMKPTKPPYSLANIVAELRELPRMLLDLKNLWRYSPRDVARNHLGWHFGWVPLVSDALSIVKAQQNLQKRIDWLIRNNGKWIRRRTSVHETSTNETGDWVNDSSAFNEIFVNSFYKSRPQSRTTLKMVDRYWASAQFRYFLPRVPPGVALSAVVKRSLQGFHPVKAYQIWNAIPWTWLVDWCLNVGDILENVDSGIADRLAARRFFIMREFEHIATKQARGNFYAHSSRSPISIGAQSSVRILRQTRLRGSPFGVSPTSLSDMQLGILGALGLSKLP